MAISKRQTTGLAIRAALLAALSGALVLGCGESSDPAPPSAASNSGASIAKPSPAAAATAASDLVEDGRQTYLSVCIACHNADPMKDGPLGPPVVGAALDLLEARILRGEYPPGYVPKRDSRAMVAMPFLEKKIPALHAYLEKAAAH